MTDNNYINMLKEEYLERKERRPQYSERAFARDLNLSPGFISLLFNQKRSLSPKKSIRIANTLNWEETKVERFMSLVYKSQLSESGFNNKIKEDIDEDQIELDKFRLISNINHISILEFIQTRDTSSIQQIIKYFQIPKTECELILSRLLRLEMITQKGIKYMANSLNRKINDIPSEAIRNYHKQLLNLATDAVDNQDYEKRELRALTLSINPEKMKQAKSAMAKFVKDFNRKYGNKQKGEIYQLNMQLFSHKKE